MARDGLLDAATSAVYGCDPAMLAVLYAQPFQKSSFTLFASLISQGVSISAIFLLRVSSSFACCSSFSASWSLLSRTVLYGVHKALGTLD